FDTGLNDVEGAADVDIERRPRELVALQKPESGEVEDPIGLFERGREDVGLADVPASLEESHPRIAKRVGEIFLGPAHEVVVDDDLSDVFSKQSVDRVGADETCATDDNQPLASDLHV